MDGDMSTISATYIQDRVLAKPHPMASAISGMAKAWGFVNQNGTQSVTLSFNMSSISDMGVGITNAPFTAPLTAQGAGLSTGPVVNQAVAANSDALKFMITYYVSNTGAAFDGYPMFAVMGNLA
jgi:hypothetical protein